MGRTQGYGGGTTSASTITALPVTRAATPSAVVPAPVRLRHAHLGDGAGLTAMLEGLSVTSAWFRFLGGLRRPSPQVVARLLQTDATHGAWLATVDAIPVGHIMWALGDDAVELGVVVTDAWQRRGIGRWLTQTALAEAAVAGATVVQLDVHTENRRAIAMVRQALPEALVTREAELLTFRAPLPATATNRRLAQPR
jgi:GNAT superfamily N-acetyltransferase